MHCSNLKNHLIFGTDLQPKRSDFSLPTCPPLNLSEPTHLNLNVVRKSKVNLTLQVTQAIVRVIEQQTVPHIL